MKVKYKEYIKFIQLVDSIIMLLLNDYHFAIDGIEMYNSRLTTQHPLTCIKHQLAQKWFRAMKLCNR